MEQSGVDEIVNIEVHAGVSETKTALKQLEFALASIRVRGGHLVKVVHDETLGASRVRIRSEIRRSLRAMKKEGRIILFVNGEDLSLQDSVSCYLVDRRPGVTRDPDWAQGNENITLVYF